MVLDNRYLEMERSLDRWMAATGASPLRGGGGSSGMPDGGTPTE